MSRLGNLLQIFDFEKVLRKCRVDETRFENDAEHSWTLAYLFLHLQKDLENEFPGLDAAKILTLIAIHDIGELGNGDVATWNKTNSDKQDELKAAYTELVEKMARKDLYELYLEMEAENPSIEIKIVKSLDRLAPTLLRIYSGIGWHDVPEKDQATRVRLDERNLHRHSFSITLTQLYLEAANYADQLGYFVQYE